MCSSPVAATSDDRLQGRIKASAGPGAVQNAGPLQAYNQLTTPTNCGPPKLGASTPSTPLNAALIVCETVL